jgi:hypothetical protein
MTNANRPQLPEQTDAVAYDRPTGQAEPVEIETPSVRAATKVVVILTCVVAAVAWMALVLTRVATSPDPRLVAILFSLLVLSNIFPLQIAYKQEMTFDLVVVVVAALLLPPVWAIPVAAAGYAAGYTARYRGRLASIAS